MRGWASRGSAVSGGTRPWLAFTSALLVACAGPAGPAGTPLDCATREAEDALLASDIPNRLVGEWLIERADCLAHAEAVGVPQEPAGLRRFIQDLFRTLGLTGTKDSA